MLRDTLNRTVILADGDFPSHPLPLAALRTARRVICCDGAAEKLLNFGRTPDVIVGDLDGLSATLRLRFTSQLIHDAGQASNDLTKAFRHCMAQGWRDVVILGATGLREDHSLGNISLLADYVREAPSVVMITDNGVFVPLLASGSVTSRPGQPVSIFRFDPGATVQARGLRWPLTDVTFTRWWQATLNEAQGETIELAFDGGPLLVFLCHEDTTGRRGEGSLTRETGANDGARDPRFPLPVALTIAGSDSGGNAGIQADLRAFHAMRVHGCTAITALTAQNPDGVHGVQLADSNLLAAQLKAIFESYAVRALKTGMLATADLIEVVIDQLQRHPDVFKVVDPVMIATSGARLLADDAVTVLRNRLLPLATLITPNRPEAEVLAEVTISSEAEAIDAALKLARRANCGVLIKGGHDLAHPARDLLCLRDEKTAAGWQLWRLTTPIVAHPLSTHGTGCTLSAAIAAALAQGRTLLDAVIAGKAFVYESIRTGRSVGPSAAVLGQPERLPVTDVIVESLPLPERA